MKPRGTRRSSTSIFTVVEVWRGMAVGAYSYSSYSGARRRYQILRRQSDIQSDDTRIFETSVDGPAKSCRECTPEQRAL